MKHIAAVLLALLIFFTLPAMAESNPSTYTLLGYESIPAPLDQRVLDDQQIQDLCYASMEELKTQISTFADYVAWVQCVNATYWPTIVCDDFGQQRIGGEFNFGFIHNMTGPNILADFCFQFLQDDYPGMKTLLSVSYQGRERFTSFSNAFPVDGGYIVIGADFFYSRAWDNARENGAAGPASHGPMFVEDLSAVIDYCQSADMPWPGGGTLAQLFVMSTDEHIAFNVEEMFYVPDRPELVESLYEEPLALPPLPTLAEYDITIPNQSEPTITDKETAIAIREGSVEEAAEKINTIEDFMNYVYLANYICGDGDKFIPLRDGLEWHFNYKPHVVYERNTGCCGATSGLIAYLLDGDYEEVGIVGITYTEGCGGGHVINYVKHEGKYYVFDVFSWGQSNYSEWGLRMCINESLKDACLQWAERTGQVQCMYTYTNPALGDAPVGWSSSVFRVSYLIRDYAENVQIHLENPEEGYVYEFVDVDPDVLQAIELVRSIW